MLIRRGFLRRQGLETQFVELPINVSDPAVWEGVKLRYWELDTYYLPVVQHADEDSDKVDAAEDVGEAKARTAAAGGD